MAYPISLCSIYLLILKAGWLNCWPSTAIVVEEAKNGMHVKSNQVYLIPSDKFMTISDDTLYLTNKEKASGPHFTINTFFNSLAADCGTKAIVVVLSGLGSDGTQGRHSGAINHLIPKLQTI
ncbi:MULTISPECIES: chemotaxis protein CheB [unclassified Mucilaginibacter]|uniref:chemotaxis protein CheB n=1 Tax=unclassified Mucilaginibacter TaxID=2617802 RepID=UPI002AC96336|nr:MULTISPECIES: chemotaxis protein CheB [unclassified Mucilaginibacter]MEB0260303.1 chemotaxis protein CheB [Mucilaginibacter sp. 10I4]MEB0277286.1 chemotaxis protein CheB [Mucilaginibacter sp. 10B2]MEB0303195.1 chemotaxis protein CheB [Mucilaginibacter sp. 5C4]WPX25412.1 chemotaxis protein CheB [Mucilaginibacter sp. 5C4]